MSEQVALVGLKRAGEKISRARAVPGVAERSAQVRAQMAETDRVHAEGRAELRNPPS
jgi:hypothetical protein